MTRAARQPKFNTQLAEKVGETPEDIFRQAKVAAARAMYLCAPAIRALNPIFMDIEEIAPGIRMTMGVDKYYRVYVGKKFVMEMVEAAKAVSPTNPCLTCGETSHHPLAYVGGTICHEAWHPIRKHAKREEGAGFKNHWKWNVAADLEINDDILEIFKACDKPKLCLPVFGVWPSKFRDTAKNAKLWDKNPIKKKLEVITDPKAAHDFVESMSYKDKEQHYAAKQVATHGEEVWKLFLDHKLAEEYYMMLPEKPPCPVHGEPCPDCGVPHGGGHGDKEEDGEGSGGEKGEGDKEGDQDGDGGDGGQQPGSGGGHGHGNSDAQCTCPWTTEHGSAVGGDPRDYELGPPSGANPGVSEAEGKLISREVAKNICNAQKTRGTMPAGMARWAEGELEPAKYNWRAELAKACRYGTGRKHGADLRSYKRLGILTGSNRGKILFPTKYDPVPDVTVVFDTSGSMDDRALKSGLQEVDGIMKALGAKIRFTAVDAEASALTDVEHIRDATLTGGGGTDMRVGIEAALSDPQRLPSVVIVMTDGFTPWPDQPINGGRTTLVCCLCGELTAELDSVPRWALGIKITGENPEVKQSEE